MNQVHLKREKNIKRKPADNYAGTNNIIQGQIVCYRLYSENQSFQTNGSLVWQGNQSITFDSRGGYIFEDNITSLTLSSSLNSTLQDLSALGFGLNYTSAINEIHISFLLQVGTQLIQQFILIPNSKQVFHPFSKDQYFSTTLISCNYQQLQYYLVFFNYLAKWNFSRNKIEMIESSMTISILRIKQIFSKMDKILFAFREVPF